MVDVTTGYSAAFNPFHRTRISTKKTLLVFCLRIGPPPSLPVAKIGKASSYPATKTVEREASAPPV